METLQFYLNILCNNVHLRLEFDFFKIEQQDLPGLSPGKPCPTAIYAQGNRLPSLFE